MNTPAHLILGSAVFARPATARLALAALAGGLLPDLSLYVLAGVSLFVLQISPQVVFGELYYSAGWQTIFAIDNSFLLWGAVLAFGLWRKSPLLIAFAGAGVLHLGLDFPLHHDDGRPHFWPLSGWVFESPLSYWDHRHGAWLVSPIEVGLCVMAVILLWRRFQDWRARLFYVLLLAVEVQVARSWFHFLL